MIDYGNELKKNIAERSVLRDEQKKRLKAEELR